MRVVGRCRPAFLLVRNSPLGGARRKKHEIGSGAASRTPVDVENRDSGASVGNNGLYAPPERPGDWGHKSSARGRQSRIFRPARNILFMNSSRYRQLDPARDVGPYRKPFLLGRNSSARGRWMLRSEKSSKIFLPPTVRVFELSLGASVGINGLYNSP